MTQTIRYPEILDIARRDGKVTVEGLADHFGVTLQTIRRDLTDLAETGRLERVHGGAILPSGTVNIAYEERRRLNAEGKAAIARVCAAEIIEECSVFLNIGTTTEAVAAELIDHENLLVVTNNMNVANILADTSLSDVIVTGGSVRKSDGGLLGDLTRAAVQHFKFDVAVIGCSALDADGDILDFDVAEVGVSRAALDRARRKVLVADHTKFARTAPAQLASLADVDLFVTDKPPPAALLRRCRDWGTDVIVAR